MKELKNNIKGITLIALVVTIIVLLILAGVSIAMLTGQSGILKQAQEARVKNAHSEVYEALNMEAGEHLIGKYTEGYPQSVIDYFLDKGYIYTMPEISGYIVNVKVLLGGNTEYGNGTDGKTDVYKLEEIIQEGLIGKVATTSTIRIAETDTGKTYKVVYYGKKTSEDAELGKIVDQKETSNEIVFYCYYQDDTRMEKM